MIGKDKREQELLELDAVIRIEYKSKKRKLEIDNIVPMWFADAMAVRYLELMAVWEKHREADK